MALRPEFLLLASGVAGLVLLGPTIMEMLSQSGGGAGDASMFPDPLVDPTTGQQTYHKTAWDRYEYQEDNAKGNAEDNWREVRRIDAMDDYHRDVYREDRQAHFRDGMRADRAVHEFEENPDSRITPEDHARGRRSASFSRDWDHRDGKYRPGDDLRDH